MNKQKTCWNTASSHYCHGVQSWRSPLSGCHMSEGVVGEETEDAPLCDRDLDPNQNGDLSANHRAPQSILSCGMRRGLQKHKTPRRSPLSLAISTEVSAFIWTGSLFSSSRRLTEFYRRVATALSCAGLWPSQQLAVRVASPDQYHPPALLDMLSSCSRRAVNE